MLVDVGARGLSGKQAEKALDAVGLTVNKNTIPFDPRPPMVASGIRIGTPAVTTRGMGLAGDGGHRRRGRADPGGSRGRGRSRRGPARRSGAVRRLPAGGMRTRRARRAPRLRAPRPALHGPAQPPERARAPRLRLLAHDADRDLAAAASRRLLGRVRPALLLLPRVGAARPPAGNGRRRRRRAVADRRGPQSRRVPVCAAAGAARALGRSPAAGCSPCTGTSAPTVGGRSRGCPAARCSCARRERPLPEPRGASPGSCCSPPRRAIAAAGALLAGEPAIVAGAAGLGLRSGSADPRQATCPSASRPGSAPGGSHTSFCAGSAAAAGRLRRRPPFQREGPGRRGPRTVRLGLLSPARASACSSTPSAP